MFVFFVSWIIDWKVTFLLWDFAPRQMGPATRIVYSVKQHFVNRRGTRGFGITAFPEGWWLFWIRQFRFFENILSACKTMNKQKSRMLLRTILSIASICSFVFFYLLIFTSRQGKTVSRMRYLCQIHIVMRSRICLSPASKLIFFRPLTDASAFAPSHLRETW